VHGRLILERVTYYGNFTKRAFSILSMKKLCGQVIYSPSDLIRYFASPFASWMDRFFLQNPDGVPGACAGRALLARLSRIKE
jgi:hypothetical protein